MLIRKLFKFENAHVVRNCSTAKCKYSIHGHSYRLEVILWAETLDNGHMVYDFTLLKRITGWIADAFDHTTCFWDRDDPAYIEAIKKFSERWISLPVSPSAEQLSRIFFTLIDDALTLTSFMNAEDSGLKLQSIIVHETDTGYAQCFREDAYNPKMGMIGLTSIKFSPAIENTNQLEYGSVNELPKQQIADPFNKKGFPT